MKIINEREKLLSNFEVYVHLKEIQEKNNWKQKDNKKDNKKHKRSFNPDLETVTGEVTSYLSKTHTAQQTEDLLVACMRDLSKFQLEKIERLQIINSAPHSLVNLYAVVEECDQRFNEDQIQDMLDIVQKYFPSGEDEGDTGEEDEEDEEEQGAAEDVEMA